MRPYRFLDGTSPVLFTPETEATAGGYLRVTDELMAAEVAALVRELKGYEARVAAGDGSFEARAELVREQLRHRGALAAKPHARSETRAQGETRERKPAEARKSESGSGAKADAK